MPDSSSASPRFFAACLAGNVVALRHLLDQDAGLVSARNSDGATGLHLAVRRPAAVRLLLERGADPNARDTGDNAIPLFFAAGGPLESVRALLDAGSDVDGTGDLHQLEVIGAATVFGAPDREVVNLLVERGARHHVFSAIALGDRDLLRRVIADDPNAIRRRLSGFEQEQTALHYVIAPPDGLGGGVFRTGDHYAILDLLIELGAELEATDAKGRTPLLLAMLRGDREAMRRLHRAGARLPDVTPASARDGAAAAQPATQAVRSIRPMLAARDMAETIAWYRAVGFELTGSHGDDGALDWASLSLGSAPVMLVPGWSPPRGVSLWIEIGHLDDLYASLRHRQLERGRAELAGEPLAGPDIPFTVDLHTAFYGQREFGIRDPNGVEIMFYQPTEPPAWTGQGGAT